GPPRGSVTPTARVGRGEREAAPTGRMVMDAARGRMPAYVDTGLNIVHGGDVAAGHLLGVERGRFGERYILGGENLTLREILVRIARLAGRSPPRIRLPHWGVLPLAYLSEGLSRLTHRGTRL